MSDFWNVGAECFIPIKVAQIDSRKIFVQLQSFVRTYCPAHMVVAENVRDACIL